MNNTFSERLKYALEYRGKTQSDLVKMTGIGKSTISQYLSGKYQAKIENIEKISKALNCESSWLLGISDMSPEKCDNWDSEWERIAEEINNIQSFRVFITSLGWKIENVFYDDPTKSESLIEDEYKLSKGGLSLNLTPEELQILYRDTKQFVNSKISSLINTKISSNSDD